MHLSCCHCPTKITRESMSVYMSESNESSSMRKEANTKERERERGPRRATHDDENGNNNDDDNDDGNNNKNVSRGAHAVCVASSSS